MTDMIKNQKVRVNSRFRWKLVFDAKRDNDGKGIFLDKLMKALKRSFR